MTPDQLDRHILAAIRSGAHTLSEIVAFVDARGGPDHPASIRGRLRVLQRARVIRYSLIEAGWISVLDAVAERTPWFKAFTDPPVIGGPDAVYEVRCLFGGEPSLRCSPNPGVVTLRSAYGIKRFRCPSCEWRGLTIMGTMQWAWGAR